MKTFLAVLLLSAACAAQSASCDTLYHHGDRDITLCVTPSPSPDGQPTYARYDTTNSGVTRSPISWETYMRLMEEDAKELQARTEQLKAAYGKKAGQY